MTNDCDFSVKQAAQLWLTKCERDKLEAWTLRSYRSHVNVHIVPRIGDEKLVNLTRKSVRDFVQNMQDDNSHSQTKKVLNSLKAILTLMVDDEYLSDNVAQSVKVRDTSRHEKERVIPTKTQIRALLDNAPAKHYPFVATALFTGMRMCELRGLRWSDVSFDARSITVRQRVDEKGKFGPPKSRAGRRTIPMAPVVIDALKNWKPVCPSSDLDLVFPNGSGKPESHANISNRVFKPLMTACGFLDEEGGVLFTMHGMRHAAASMLIEGEFNPKQIQAIMGHSSINMTFDVYGHLFADPERDAEMMAAMQEKFLAA